MEDMGKKSIRLLLFIAVVAFLAGMVTLGEVGLRRQKKQPQLKERMVGVS